MNTRIAFTFLIIFILSPVLYSQVDPVQETGRVINQKINQLKDILDLTTQQTQDVVDIFNKTIDREQKILQRKSEIEKEEIELERTRGEKIEKVLTAQQKEKFKKTKGMPGLLGAHDAREFGWSHKKDNNSKNKGKKEKITEKAGISKNQRAEIARLILDEGYSVNEALDEVLEEKQKQRLTESPEQKTEKINGKPPKTDKSSPGQGKGKEKSKGKDRSK